MMQSKSYNFFVSRHKHTPEKVLGDNFSIILDFWTYLDTLDLNQFVSLRKLRTQFPLKQQGFYNELEEHYPISRLFWNNVFDDIVDDYRIRIRVAGAAFEIYHANKIIKSPFPFVYLPLFENL